MHKHGGNNPSSSHFENKNVKNYFQVEDKVAEENKKNEQNTEDANKESNAKIENEAKPVITNDKMELKYKYREGKLFFIKGISSKRSNLQKVCRSNWEGSGLFDCGKLADFSLSLYLIIRVFSVRPVEPSES